MRIKVPQAGQVGLILDRDDIELPPNAWTDGRNIRFQHGSVRSAFGWSANALTADEVFAGNYLRAPSGDFLVLAVDTTANGIADDVVSWDGATETSLTWSSTGTAADLVTMTQLHGYVIINNGADSPSFWDGEALSVSPLIYDGATTWATETYSAKVIRSFRNFLIAMDVTDAVGRNPRLLHWSSPAVPGNLPASWDFSDITEESGRQELAETTGVILDGAPLRDMFVVYKEDAIYLVNYIAGQFVFSFYPVSSDRGIYTTNCVAQVGSKHFVMGQRDVYLFDGSSEPVSVIEGKAREYLFNAIDPDAYRITHLVHNRADNEVWICYPTVGETRCNEAMVFNYVEGTWSRRDLPGVNSTILGGNLDVPVSDWDDETALDWDSETEATWTSSNYTTGIDVLYGLGVALYKLDDTNQQDAVDQVCFVERTEFSIGELDDWYMVRAVFPRATGGAFTVEVGYQATQDSEVTWSDPQTWTPGTSRRLDFRVTGRMLALRVKSTGNTSWELFSVDVDAVPVGTR